MTDDELRERAERLGYSIGYVLAGLFWIGLLVAVFYAGKRVGAAAAK